MLYVLAGLSFIFVLRCIFLELKLVESLKGIEFLESYINKIEYEVQTCRE